MNVVESGRKVSLELQRLAFVPAEEGHQSSAFYSEAEPFVNLPSTPQSRGARPGPQRA